MSETLLQFSCGFRTTWLFVEPSFSSTCIFTRADIIKGRLATYCKSAFFVNKMAEREGFEPPDPFKSTVFKTAAIDHSAISPCYKKYPVCYALCRKYYQAFFARFVFVKDNARFLRITLLNPLTFYWFD